MTLVLGYATSTLIFLGFFAVTLALQVVSRRYHAWRWPSRMRIIMRHCTLGTVRTRRSRIALYPRFLPIRTTDALTLNVDFGEFSSPTAARKSNRI